MVTGGPKTPRQLLSFTVLKIKGPTGRPRILGHGKRPTGLAGLIVYMPDLTPEEYERHFAEDIRKAILHEK